MAAGKLSSITPRRVALLCNMVIAPTLTMGQSQRLVLVEHFTQASCTPCANQDPALDDTLKANSNKVIAIKHQTSWPGNDPMHNHYPAGPNGRVAYYGINGVPTSIMDGGPGDRPGIIVTPSTIDSAYAVASPFDITLSATRSGTLLTATMDITCTQSVAGDLKARIAVIEKHIEFDAAPGSAGETDFYNVCKQYLPDTAGTDLADSWAVNDSQTITQSWSWSNVYRITELAVVAFIQDDANRVVHQAAYAPMVAPNLPDDAGIYSIPSSGGQCVTSHTPQVVLFNYGSNTLSSVVIHYDVDGGTPSTYKWTGSLAVAESTTVILPTLFVPSGAHTFSAWTTAPNGRADTAPANDGKSEPLLIGSEAFDLTLMTDCYGSEISWQVQDSSGFVWASGSGYPNVSNGATYKESFCLALGACYDFIINDSYGDGLNGSQAGCSVDGSYTITDARGDTVATLLAPNGAFGRQEINPFCVAADVIPVNTVVDEDNGNANPNDGAGVSLREAIAYFPEGITITFTHALAGQTLFLTNSIVVDRSLTIDASALAGGLVLDGMNLFRVLQIDAGSSVTLSNLVIRNGQAPPDASGGGIVNAGELTLVDSTITGNRAGDSTTRFSAGVGGGIYSTGSLTLERSTISSNTAGSTGFFDTPGGSGGGIYSTGNLTIHNSTIAGNATGLGDTFGTAGGGICIGDGAASLLHATVIGNRAQADLGLGGNPSGGIAVFGTLQLDLSIVAGNTAPGVPDLYGSFSGTNNLVGVDPHLAPLGFYGGPTQTMPPLPGSPVMDAGTVIGLATDQRGYPRLVGLAPDIGAAEGVYSAAGPGTIGNFTSLQDGSVQFSFTNVTGAVFPVFATTNLALPSGTWPQIGFVSEDPAGSGQFPFVDTEAKGFQHRYYRVNGP
jgi:hypothetical protein